jgi:hypothetical protein
VDARDMRGHDALSLERMLEGTLVEDSVPLCSGDKQ